MLLYLFGLISYILIYNVFSFTIPKIDKSMFQKCTTIRELKQNFRRIALEFHPDTFAAQLHAEYSNNITILRLIEEELTQNFLILRNAYDQRLYELEHPDSYSSNSFSHDAHSSYPDDKSSIINIADPRKTLDEWFHQLCSILNVYKEMYSSTSILSPSKISWSISRNSYNSLPRLPFVQDITISLLDTLVGNKLPYNAGESIPCNECGGNGHVFPLIDAINRTTTKQWESPTCSICKGTGKLRSIWTNNYNLQTHSHTREGIEFNSRSCIHCCGTGHGPVLLCPICMGNGLIYRNISGILHIPPGVYNDDLIKLSTNFQPLDTNISHQHVSIYPSALKVTIDPLSILPWTILYPHIQKNRNITLLKYCLIDKLLIKLPTGENVYMPIENKDCCHNGGKHNIIIPGQGLYVYKDRPDSYTIGGPIINNRGHVVLTLNIIYPVRISDEEAEQYQACFGYSSLTTLYSISDFLMEMYVNNISDNIEENNQTSNHVLYSCDAGNPERTLIYYTKPEFII